MDPPLPGSPPLLSPGSGAPTPASLYRSEPLYTSSSITSSSSTTSSSSSTTTTIIAGSPAQPHSHSPSPRLPIGGMPSFLSGPGGGGGGGAPLISPGGSAGAAAAAAAAGGPPPLGPLGPLAGLTHHHHQHHHGNLSSLSSPLSSSSSPPNAAAAAAGTGECKLVDVHGVKVASFRVDGRELICLPQVFELFLKHLVGGLHTVYTKLKRLDIAPVVCTVEQVRVLRGLGAIQPGVNRCKLISRRDFDTLYGDCTSASSRPGRPPKRCSGVGLQESPRLLHTGLPGLLSPNLLSHTGLTAAAMAELQKLQKMKMMLSLQNGNESDNDDIHSNTGGSECSWDKERLTSPSSGGHGGGGVTGGVATGGARGAVLGAVNQQQLQQQQQLLANRLDLPFMMMPHPLLPVGLPPASVAMAMSQMNHLNTIANMAAAAQQISTHTHRTPVIKERVCDSPSPSPSVDTPLQSHPSSSASSSPDRLADLEVTLTNPVASIKKMTSDKEESSLALPAVKPDFDRLPSGQVLPPGFPAPFLFADGLSSVETLLTNIQGLLKVAVENARVQDKQIQAEKRELKMELYREREMRETLERQLNSELQSRASIQKRLKKEKKAKRRLQEALEFESKRRERVEEDALKLSSPSPEPQPLHSNSNHSNNNNNNIHSSSNNHSSNNHSNDSAGNEEKPELNGNQRDSAAQESRSFLKSGMMF